VQSITEEAANVSTIFRTDAQSFKIPDHLNSNRLQTIPSKKLALILQLSFVISRLTIFQSFCPMRFYDKIRINFSRCINNACTTPPALATVLPAREAVVANSVSAIIEISIPALQKINLPFLPNVDYKIIYQDIFQLPLFSPDRDR